MNLFFKMLIGFLLFFLTFAFAGTEAWAFSIFQYGLFIIALCVAFTSRTLYVTRPLKILSYLMFFLAGFAILQSCFPHTLAQGAAWYPTTVLPLYTMGNASLFLTYIVVAWLVVQLYPSSENGRHLLLVMILCGCAVALCAASLPKGGYLFSLLNLRKGFGPFFNRNHAAVFMAMGAVGMLSYFFTSYIEHSRKIMKNQRVTFYIRQSCLALVFLGLCAGVISTRSRGGMLSLTVGIFTYAFLCVWAVPLKLRRRLKGFFITMAALALVSGLVATHVDDINAFAQRSSGASEMKRKMFYRSTFRALKDYPYFGTGLGTTPLVIHNYFEWSEKKYVNYLHCDWLEILLGMGYIGVIPVLFLLGWLAWVFLRRLRKLNARKQFLYAGLLSMMMVMCMGSVTDFHFFIPANAFLFFLTAGLACAPSFYKGHTHLLHMNWLKYILLVGLFTMAVWVPTRKTIAWRFLFQGRGLKPETRAFLYEKAVSYYPSPRNAMNLAITYYNAGVHSRNLELRYAYWRQANRVTKMYLERYPKDKELSQLYMRTRHIR